MKQKKLVYLLQNGMMIFNLIHNPNKIEDQCGYYPLPYYQKERKELTVSTTLSQ